MTYVTYMTYATYVIVMTYTPAGSTVSTHLLLD
jgi:hypothetical protein